MNGVPISVADISALVDRIRSHRFDGYTDIGLADEIDLFRAGAGTEGLGAAVDALKAVGDALVSTERTLREELGKLGVEWQSDAGIQAGAAIDREAAFSADANEKVSHSAEMIFAQGEAFNRTLHKLPDSRTLREGAGGYSLGDSLFSLIGYETDHTRKVLAAREARQQALEALNGYARESGENLGSVQPMSRPEALQMSAAPRLPGSVDAGGGPLPDTSSPTVAADAAGEQGRAPAQGQAPAPLRGPAPVAEAPAPAMGATSHPAPAARGAGAQAPAATVPSGTAPSASAPSTSAPGTSGTGGFVGAVRPGPQPDPGRVPAAGGGSGAAAPLAPGAAVGGVAGTGSGAGAGAGSSSGSTQGGAAGAKQGQASPTGRPAVPGGPTATPMGGVAGKFVPQAGTGTPGGQAANETQLGKGKSFGSVPQPAQQPGPFSGSVTPAQSGGPGRAGDLSGGIAALGAGGVAGALSGQDERKGRGVGRSAPGAARSPHQLPVGDLPEEEARVSRNSEKLNPRGGKGQSSFMERAAPQDGESDEGHVRKFGIDDSDLFADPRMVSPDVITGSDTDRR